MSTAEAGMSVSTSLFLITLGAILKYAVNVHVAGIELRTAGLILMVVGAIGLGTSLFVLIRGSSIASGRSRP
jgi:hypothetical protein